MGESGQTFGHASYFTNNLNNLIIFQQPVICKNCLKNVNVDISKMQAEHNNEMTSSGYGCSSCGEVTMPLLTKNKHLNQSFSIIVPNTPKRNRVERSSSFDLLISPNKRINNAPGTSGLIP